MRNVFKSRLGVSGIEKVLPEDKGALKVPKRTTD